MEGPALLSKDVNKKAEDASALDRFKKWLDSPAADAMILAFAQQGQRPDGGSVSAAIGNGLVMGNQLQNQQFDNDFKKQQMDMQKERMEFDRRRHEFDMLESSRKARVQAQDDFRMAMGRPPQSAQELEAFVKGDFYQQQGEEQPAMPSAQQARMQQPFSQQVTPQQMPQVPANTQMAVPGSDQISKNLASANEYYNRTGDRKGAEKIRREGMPASELQKGLIQADIAKLKEAEQLAAQSPNIINRVNLFRDANKNYETGQFGDWQLAARKATQAVSGDFLVDPKKTAYGEVINKFGTDFVLDFIQRTKGAISNQEMQRFSESSPGLTATRKGNELIANTLEAVELRNQEKAQFLRAYINQNGTLDGSEQTWNKFIDDNPIINEDMSLNRKNISDWKRYINPNQDPYAGMSDEQFRQELDKAGYKYE